MDQSVLISLRRALSGLLLAALAMPAMACAPARELDFTNTSWLITRVGDADVAAAERATIEFGGSEVSIDLACGSVPNLLYFDSDGSALHLMSQATVDAACGGDTTQVERMQLEALRDVTSWRIETNDRIVLEGGPEVVLDRIPAGL